MKTTMAVRLSLLLLVAAGLISCARPGKPAANATFVPQEEKGPYTVIGHLQHRDRVVTIKSGAQGMVYSVQSPDGKVLYENLTPEQLQAKAPEIHDFIEGSNAIYAGLLKSVPAGNGRNITLSGSPVFQNR